ncbi:hypothetical protein H8356DRAFT_1358716 [Neocallimastix lanati (nom. inval.)]|nr:hypothetical protein H8356DRAFT_1358716 [Neocallimastix sp. JGI-2020a]
MMQNPFTLNNSDIERKKYGFSFEIQKLTINEMYKDYKDDPSIQYKKVLIKQYPNSSDINIHNNDTILYIILLDLNYKYPNENFYFKQFNYLEEYVSAKRKNFRLPSVILQNIDISLNTVLIPKEFTDQLISFGYKL